MTDITSRSDIARLVDTFYECVRSDDLLGPIFQDIARVHWPTHLPKMYAFWETVLFGVGGFKGNPLAAHVTLAQRTPLTAREFDRWVALFDESVDTLYAGPVAADAKRRARQIADTMQHHIAAAHAAASMASAD